MDLLVPALQKIHASDEVKGFMKERGFGWAWLGPKEAVDHMAKADAEFGRLMKDAGLVN